MDKYSELEVLKRLLDDGAITQEEYQEEKAKILAGYNYEYSDAPWGMEENVYCTFMHLSQFLGWMIPFAGFVMPIVMWISNRDKNEYVDLHGCAIVNWMISALIYTVIAAILCIFIIGIPLLILLILLGLIFPIIGAVKASSGQLWDYPMAIRFFTPRRVVQ